MNCFDLLVCILTASVIVVKLLSPWTSDSWFVRIGLSSGIALLLSSALATTNSSLLYIGKQGFRQNFVKGCPCLLENKKNGCPTCSLTIGFKCKRQIKP